MIDESLRCLLVLNGGHSSRRLGNLISREGTHVKGVLTCLVGLDDLQTIWSASKSSFAWRDFIPGRDNRRGASPFTSAAFTIPLRPPRQKGNEATAVDVSQAPLPNRNKLFSSVSVIVWRACRDKISLKFSRVFSPMIVLPQPESNTAFPGDDTRATPIGMVSTCWPFFVQSSIVIFETCSAAQTKCSTAPAPCSMCSTMLAPCSRCDWLWDDDGWRTGVFLHSLAQWPTSLQRRQRVLFLRSSTSIRKDRFCMLSLWNFLDCFNLDNSWRLSFQLTAKISATSFSSFISSTAGTSGLSN